MPERKRKECVGILGLGYVGLPLSLLFAEAGTKVIGLDPDETRVRELSRGTSPIRHIDGGRVKAVVAAKTFEATTNFSALKQATSAIICVPTPLTRQREPDLSYVAKAAAEIARHAKPGILVVLESTTYPGTTREVVMPILEARGWKLGKDFFLAFSPEREDPNNEKFSTENIPKVVGGMDAGSLERALALYRTIIHEAVPVSTCEVAEAAKLLENIFRSVNIALVNELKLVFDRMNIDVWEVIEAARTKPFGFMPFYPGPGLGGHCIPIDPFYLTWKAREFDLSTKFIELAGEINTLMPYFVMEKVRQALNTKGKGLLGRRVLVLGLAYKKDVEDTRESPAFKLIDLLEKSGAKVDYHDPFVPVLEAQREFPQLESRRSRPLSAQTVKSTDLVLLTTNHTGIDYELVRKHAPLIVDTRRVYKPVPGRIFGA